MIYSDYPKSKYNSNDELYNHLCAYFKKNRNFNLYVIDPKTKLIIHSSKFISNIGKKKEFMNYLVNELNIEFK